MRKNQQIGGSEGARERERESVLLTYFRVWADNRWRVGALLSAASSGWDLGRVACESGWMGWSALAGLVGLVGLVGCPLGGTRGLLSGETTIIAHLIAHFTQKERALDKEIARSRKLLFGSM